MLTITGTCETTGKKITRDVEGDSKAEIWNNPEDYGFRKIFKVDFKETKGTKSVWKGKEWN